MSRAPASPFRPNTVASELLLDARLAATDRIDRARARWTRTDLAARYRDTGVFGLFIGYSRSGHSIVGSVIDAHAHAVAAHRLHALRYIQRGDSLERVMYMAELNSARFARQGRRLTGYQYAVPGAHQGRCDHVRAVCDQEGEQNVKTAAGDPDVLDRLHRAAGARAVRMVHVVRNPFDNIATMSLRTLKPLDSAADRYFALCDGVASIRRRVGAETVLDVWHDQFVGDPPGQIRRLMGFLGLDADPAFIARCAATMHPAPHASRFRRDWTPAQVARVAERAAAHPWIAHYRYDEGARP